MGWWPRQLLFVENNWKAVGLASGGARRGGWKSRHSGEALGPCLQEGGLEEERRAARGWTRPHMGRRVSRSGREEASRVRTGQDTIRMQEKKTGVLIYHHLAFRQIRPLLTCFPGSLGRSGEPTAGCGEGLLGSSALGSSPRQEEALVSTASCASVSTAGGALESSRLTGSWRGVATIVVLSKNKLFIE